MAEPNERGESQPSARYARNHHAVKMIDDPNGKDIRLRDSVHETPMMRRANTIIVQ